MVELSVQVTPPWPFRLPRMLGRDGVMLSRDGVLHRLVHVGDAPVVVRVAQPAPERVVFGADGPTEEACAHGIERVRFALGVDDDLSAFHALFKDDPLIGQAVRMHPWIRPVRRPEPFEALAWAITEQLIEYVRAAEIQRRILRRYGRRCERTGLRDLPTPATLAAQAPVQLQALDLSARRSLALVKAAREVAAGRVDLHDPDHERGWERLRTIATIGQWTLDILAYLGQGRMDVVPAGDLNLIKLVARLKTGNPHARSTEEDVREFFAPYAPWGGLAATYALSLPTAAGPHRAGTRWSPRSRDRLAA
jgi:3-methyladenine DNA glycosylase/8-oxoguanine DNA glycosylase